ncbi:MAG: fumarylacetoacetate hydrolase family protein [Xanthobacteraceae bacterium]
MKLASLKSGRDGRLVVVSRDLTRCADASAVAPTLQAALDGWDAVAPKLKGIVDALEDGRIAHTPFDQAQCAAPLPRAHGWADGSAYVNHVALVRQARGADLPASFWTDPLMYRGASDGFLGCRDPISGDAAWGIDLEGEVGVIAGDVPMGASAAAASDAIRLIVILNDVSFRNLIPGELAKGFGFLQGKGQTAFSPVAVTPDELGGAWDGAKLSGALLSSVNGRPFGRPDAGIDMTFDFPTLIAHAVKTRPLLNGVIVGSGTVSNRDADGSSGRPIDEGGVGYSCIAELRSVETIRHGAPKTPFLSHGDRVRIDMNDAEGCSIFGVIEQEVVRFTS